MNPKILTPKLIRHWLPRRRSDSHKGDYGHTLIVAGARGMVGAGVLSAWGALRGGSGLVTLATVRSQQSAAAAKLRPEAMTFALDETSDGTLSSKNISPLLARIAEKRITSLVLGPGLSRNAETARFVRGLLARLAANTGTLRGTVLDADGFLALAAQKPKPLSLPVIVTPHPGELARFLRVPTAAIQAERSRWAEKFARLYGVICVLKGHRTVISDGKAAYVNPTGNPGMATGGTGDVLSGLIGALIGQFGTSLYLFRAACAGVYLHGLAGDLAAESKGRISMLAGDLAERIPDAIKKFSS